MFTIYLRILGLLRRERILAIALAAGNLALAGFFYLEPLLFGRVIDAMVAKLPDEVWRNIGLWLAVGLVGVAANVWTSLQADRLAHRRRLAVMTRYFSHAISLPLSFHRQHHTGRLMRILHMGSSNLFIIWLGFFREHLADAAVDRGDAAVRLACELETGVADDGADVQLRHLQRHRDAPYAPRPAQCRAPSLRDR